MHHHQREKTFDQQQRVSWPGWALSSTFARLIHVDVKVFRELALVWRRWVRIPRLLSDHHFHAVTTDHLTMHQVNRATSRLSTVVLHVTVLPACSAQQSTSMSHLSQQQSASTHTVDFESAKNIQSWKMSNLILLRPYFWLVNNQTSQCSLIQYCSK